MASEFVEQALIASFFQGRNKTEVQEQLLDVDPEWLEGAATKPLLAAMRACLLGGEAIIEATILGQLRAAGELGVDSCYWPAFQEVLAFTEPQPIDKLVAEIRDDYLRRQALLVLEEKKVELQDTSRPAIEVIGNLPEKIDAILNKEAVDSEAWNGIIERAAEGDALKDSIRQGGWFTEEVNEIYKIPVGAVTFVVARLNIGKSIWGMTCAKATAFHGERVLWVNQDMPAEFAKAKLVSCFSEVPQWKIEKGMTSKAERDAIREAGQILRERVTFMHFPGMTPLDKMKPKVIQAIRKNRISCVIWDQFSMIGKDRSMGKRDDVQAAFISRSIKNLASSCDVAVVMLAQANRGAGTGEPAITDIAETDAIGQDACGIFTLWANEDRAKSADDFDFGGAKTSEKWKNVPYIDMRLAKSQISPAGEVWHLFRDGERNCFKMDVRLT